MLADVFTQGHRADPDIPGRRQNLELQAYEPVAQHILPRGLGNNFGGMGSFGL